MATHSAAAAEQASHALVEISHAWPHVEASQNVDDPANMRLHGEDNMLVSEQMNSCDATTVFVSGSSMGSKEQMQPPLQPAIVGNTFAVPPFQPQITATAPIVYGTATVHHSAPFRPGLVDPAVYLLYIADMG